MDSQALDIQYEIVIEEEKSHEMEMEQEDKKDLLELDRGITGNYGNYIKSR